METYGSYQLLKRLATGGMAQIYLARQAGLETFDELLVVKRILPHLAENADFVRMFLDEARIAARLNHPNIVQIFNLGALDDSYFIAMEYIHGEDVRRVWKRSEQRGTVLPLPLVCRIVIEACAGLDYAHKRTDQGGKPLGIVHRDVSPQNILVTFQGGVKVVDFGIAKAADQAVVTRSGVLKGKYSYMSPEQALGKKLDHRSDIFALGVVLYELLTGSRLFKRANDIQTLNAVTDGKVSPPSLLDEEIPKDLDAIVLKALAREPDQRFQEATELGAALEGWISKHQHQASKEHLAAFMQELYADRLAEEKAAGHVLVQDADHPKRSDDDAYQPMDSGSGGSRQSVSSPDLSPLDQHFPAPPVPASLPAMDKRSRSVAAPVPAPARPPDPADAERTDEIPPPSAAELALRASGVAPAALPPTEDRDSQPSITNTDSQPRFRNTAQILWDSALRPKVPRVPVAAVVAALAVVAGAAYLIFRPSTANSEAIVRINSDPAEATVLFDGRPLPDLTPCELPKVPAGQYSLVVGKRGYLDHETVVIVPSVGEITFGPVKLERDPNALGVAPTVSVEPDAGILSGEAQVDLTLGSEPSGAAIFLNEKPSGRTPKAFVVPANSEVSVRMEYRGYFSLTERLHIGADSFKKLQRLDKITPELSRHPQGRVLFDVNPWATVTCVPSSGDRGSRKLGATTQAEQYMRAGSYQCSFINPERGTKTVKVDVVANTVQTVRVQL